MTIPEALPRVRAVDSDKGEFSSQLCFRTHPLTDAVWTTLLTNTKYLTGLLTLDHSLKAVGTKYPLLVLYTDGLTPDGHAALDARGIRKQRIEYLLPTGSNDYSNDERFYDCWSTSPPVPAPRCRR